MFILIAKANGNKIDSSNSNKSKIPEASFNTMESFLAGGL